MNIQQAEKFFKKHWHWLTLVLLVSLFFIATASYNYFIQKNDFIKWESPDESANYLFTKLYGQTGQLTIFEKYNFIAGDIMHPRSIRSDLGNLKPISFLGIILIFGFIVNLASYKIIPFLTPAFGSIGILFFYFFIKKIFGRRNAILSALLLASFPVYIYYSSRSMFHNVLFIVLLIIGFYYSVLIVKNGNKKIRKFLSYFYASLGGFFIGLAIITRTSELLWIAPILIITWLFNIKKVGFTKLIIFLSFLFLAILPVFYYNQILYGSPINGGYPEMNQSILNITSASADLVKSTASGELSHNKEFLEKIKDNIFHFGFSAKQSFKMFYYYFVSMFSLFFWPAMLGLFLFLQDFYKWRKKHLVYFLSFSILSAILIFYYGSWEFHDNPDPKSFTIGNSYTRYWLPIYLGVFPFFAIFLSKFTEALFPDFKYDDKTNIDNYKYEKGYGYLKYFAKKYLRIPKRKFLINSSRVIFIILIYFFSTQFILFGSEEGLIYSAQKYKSTKNEYEQVINLTESSSVIITRYHDKIFFPERKVIVGLFDDYNMNINYAKLVNYMPVYYYNFTFPEKDINFLNNIKLKEVGLQIKKQAQITSDFSLYKLFLSEDEDIKFK